MEVKKSMRSQGTGKSQGKEQERNKVLKKQSESIDKESLEGSATGSTDFFFFPHRKSLVILEQQSENISAVLQESTNCKLYWKGGWEKSREKKKVC